MNAERPIGVGIVGCGEITQVMHLPILHELDAFVPAGLCDLSARTLSKLSARWGVPETTTDYRELIASPDVEAVLVSPMITSRSRPRRLPPASTCWSKSRWPSPSTRRARSVLAADAAGVVAQVGYMKLFDPALERAQMRLHGITGVRSITCHDFSGSFARHVPLYTQVRGDDVPASTLDAARGGHCHRGSARCSGLIGLDTPRCTRCC